MNDKKHILILGAGFMQKPAIQSAKEMGWQVTVADGNPKALCASLADRFEPIDLKDRIKLAQLAKDLQSSCGLDGVFTAGTDFSASVAWIAQECSLPGHSWEAACNATDKFRMRECFAEHQVPSPKFIRCNKESLDIYIQTNRSQHPLPSDFPLVVKPVDNMGARGCRMVFNQSQLIEGVKDAIAYSRSGYAIVEEYMEGPEFSIDSLVCNGKVVITGFADRHIYYPPYFIEMGHTMPTTLSSEQQAQIIKVFTAGIKALGLNWGAAKGDIKLTANGPMIGEIAGRLSGGYMSGWTYPYASGYNLTKEALLLAIGTVPSIFNQNSQPQAFSAERAWVSIPGKIEKIHGFDKAKSISGVQDLFPRHAVGDTVRFPVNNVEKCGNIISRAHTRIQAVQAAETAVQCIVLELQSHNKDTDDFLASDTIFPPSAFEIKPEDQKKLDSISPDAKITAEQSVLAQIPDFLMPYLDTATDWNKKTLRLALEQYLVLAPKVDIPAALFWKTALRGSVQGLLYLASYHQAKGHV